MKKWLPLLFVVTVMLFLSAGVAYAEKATLTPKLILDGKVLEPRVPPVVMDNYVLVPVRIATENLGFKVDYIKAANQVKVTNGSKQLVMTLDQSTAYVNGEAKTMDMPPTVQSNTTLIPIRFLSNALGIDIVWDNVSKSVFLYSPAPEPEEPGGTDPGTNPGENPGTDPGTETPPVIEGYIHEIRYESNAVVVSYDGSLSPNAFKLDNPSRIVLDLPKAAYAESFSPAIDFKLTAEGKFPVVDHPGLQSVRYSMFGTDAVKAPRIVLDLNQGWDYELLTDVVLGELRIFLKQPTAPEPEKPSKALYTVVLDAGHGGSDPGAKSISGKWEKEFNLSVILKVKALLEKDERIRLVLTRESDTYPTLDDRVNIANKEKADVFVSVHGNSYTPATNGTETYYNRENSKELANLLHSLIVPAAGLKDRGVKTAGFVVIKKTTMPAVLLEIGYLSSAIDEPKMWTEDLQNRVAQAIATGIKQFLKLS